MGQKVSSPPATTQELPITAPSKRSRKKSCSISQESAATVESTRRVVEQNKSQFGLEHPHTLSSMLKLGMALHGDRRIEKALQVFQELLPLNKKVLGPGHADTLATLDAICEELCNMGKYELSLTHLIEQRQLCERTLGLEHERTILVLVDIANLFKLLGKTEDASATFSLALDRGKKGLGEGHALTLAIMNDQRNLGGPLPPDINGIEALLRQNGLPVSSNPFPNFKSATWRDIFAGKRISPLMTVSYEASIALSLRMGPINGNTKPTPVAHIPPYYEDTNKITLERSQIKPHPGNSFESLIDRSVAILPQLGVGSPTTKQAIDKHIAFLKNLKSIDELLIAKDNPVWFFQSRESFMQQTIFQRWDPNLLERYVLLPMEGGVANSEDCIFISHFWQTQPHPDPDGKDLRQLQQLLTEGFWSKASLVWIDWTCLPQWERTAPQQQYFSRALWSIPKLVRDCAFVAQFSEFQPRLWVLFEVAAFTFNRAEPVGLPCTDTFQNHLQQMRADGVRLILDKYQYKCTNKSDREWVINSLEILIALRKAVPSIHTRRQILDAIDNAAVRSCTHQEAGVEIDKERGTLKLNGTVIFQFNPLPTEESASDIRIAGDYGTRLARAQQRADESFDNAGIGEIAREYDKAGDYRIAEILHRRAVVICEDPVTIHDLSLNLEHQEQYDQASIQCWQHINRFGQSDKLSAKLVALRQQDMKFKLYHRWKSQPLENSLLQLGGHQTITSTENVEQVVVRNGLRRSFLQRLDQSVWKCEEPVVMKSTEERALIFEKQGRFAEAQQLYWNLLRRRKELLGPCHVDTRRSLFSLARAYRLSGMIQNAHKIYGVASAVCDFTLGPTHPESRAVLGDLAAMTLLQGQQGVARSYCRQQLERTLAVAEWDDPESFAPKFFLQGFTRGARLEIRQNGAATTVNILQEHPIATPDTNLKNIQEKHKGHKEQQNGIVVLDMENSDIMFDKFIIAY
ncbi:hypothetical protein TWF694_007304 [Orbilia ellipsospora]|uniref:Kinesin light chain n=1 Tax=Orbilia ellipsospora TaxID=2528407 RepID=A0AAV9XHB6_9PEZI